MTVYYEDEAITLYLGDCRDAGEWTTADVLITDPPYGVAFASGWVKDPTRRLAGDTSTAIRDDALAMWGEGRPWAIFGTWRAPRPAGTTQVLIWDKSDGVGPGMGDLAAAFGTSHEDIYLGGPWPKTGPRQGSVIRTRVSMGALTTRIGHPTPKPVGLMGTLVAASAGTVADPFAGSGSTLVAAKMLGRRAIGVEVDERYAELAAGRLAQGVLPYEDGDPEDDDGLPPALWIGEPDPDCPRCGGIGFGGLTYEAGTDSWDATECPCTHRRGP